MTAKWQYKEAYEAALVTARELRAENAMLQASNEVIAEDHAALCEHNAKLRELLDYMTPIAWYVASERERDRMRELGVEVDDG